MHAEAGLVSVSAALVARIASALNQPIEKFFVDAVPEAPSNDQGYQQANLDRRVSTLATAADRSAVPTLMERLKDRSVKK